MKVQKKKKLKNAKSCQNTVTYAAVACKWLLDNNSLENKSATKWNKT